MEKQYFVTIFTSDKRMLRQLQAYDLDLFKPTARRQEEARFAIEGLLTLSDVGQLVEAGYQVLVEDTIERRSRGAREVIGFQEWLQGMEEA